MIWKISLSELRLVYKSAYFENINMKCKKKSKIKEQMGYKRWNVILSKFCGGGSIYQGL